MICYFLKWIKSALILVQCNTSLSKNYVAYSVTVVCAIGWIWEKMGLSALSGSLCIWIHIRQQSTWNISWISNLLKTVEVRMLSNSNLNFVTSLVWLYLTYSSSFATFRDHPVCMNDLPVAYPFHSNASIIDHDIWILTRMNT